VVNYYSGIVLEFLNSLLYALRTTLTVAPLLTLLQLYAVPKICCEELKKGKELKMCREFEEAGFRIST